jgi:O-antigen/teichoic acid export membrane protein
MLMGRLPFNLEDRESLGRKLIDATVGSAGVRLAGVAVTFLIGVQLARYLGPAGYGIYGSVMAVVTLLAVPGQFGLPQLLTRELSGFTATGTLSRVKGALVWSTAVVCAVSVLIAAAAWLGFQWWDGKKDVIFSAAMLWGLAYVPVMALVNLGIAALRGFQYVVSAQSYDALIRPALFAASLFVAAQGSRGLNSPLAMALQTFAGLITLAICVAQIIRCLPGPLVTAPAILHVREWAKSATPMCGTEILRVFDSQYAILLLGILATIDQVGVFRVAQSTAGFIALPSTLITVVIMPYVAELHVRGDGRRLQLIASGAASIMFACTSAVTCCLLFFGKPLLALIFGKAFMPAWLPLVLMGVAYSVNGFFGSAASILNMCGYERAVTGVYALRPMIGILSTWLLFGWFGISAVAIGMILTEIVAGLMMWHIASAGLSVDTSLTGTITSVAGILWPKTVNTGAGAR